MFDPIQWLDDCEAALLDADHLATWLARSAGADIAAELDDLRIRIAVLRAEIQRARVDLAERANGGGSFNGSSKARWAASPAPWDLKRE